MNQTVIFVHRFVKQNVFLNETLLMPVKAQLQRKAFKQLKLEKTKNLT